MENLQKNLVLRAAPSVLTGYMKSQFTVDDKQFVGVIPNTLLGVIPLGSKKTTYLLRQISGVQIDNGFLVLNMLLGVLLVIMGISVMFTNSGFWGIVATVSGIIMFQSGKATTISVATSGGICKYSVAFWERKKTNAFVEEFNKLLSSMT